MKTGGRKKGTPNKRTAEIIALAQKIEVDPIKFLLLVVKGDLRDFGYVFPEDDIYNPEVDPERDEEDRSKNLFFDRRVGAFHPKHMIPLDLRILCAKEVAQYLAPKRKSGDGAEGDEEDTGIDTKIQFVALDEFNKPKDAA